MARTLGIDDNGLVVGAGTVLARMAKDGRLSLDTQDRERLLALLSVAARRAIPADALHPIESAAGHWQRGDKALANLRLVFAGLPRLAEPADAWRLRLAEALLDEGLPPRTLMTELGLDPAPLDLGKVGYNPNQPRVPAGNGRESGQWEAIWNRIVSWLDEPVPEYDQDDGTEVGTRTRGRAIATNPLTVGIVGTAALLGAEALLPAAAEAVVPAAVEPAGIGVNAARGLASQARVLEDMGLIRNTQAVATAEGRSVPDALTDFQSIEIKDAARVSLTKQLRIQTEAADASGRYSILVTGEKTGISTECVNAFDKVIRRSDLGPR